LWFSKTGKRYYSVDEISFLKIKKILHHYLFWDVVNTSFMIFMQWHQADF